MVRQFREAASRIAWLIEETQQGCRDVCDDEQIEDFRTGDDVVEKNIWQAEGIETSDRCLAGYCSGSGTVMVSVRSPHGNYDTAQL